MKATRFATRLTLPIVLLLAGLVAGGCDSAEEALSDVERIRGDWNLTSLRSEDEDLSNLLSQALVGMRFGSDNRFSMELDPVGSQPASTVLSGTYAVEPLTKTLILTTTVQEQQVPYTASYSFEGEDRMVAVVNAVLLNTVLGTNLSGNLTMTFMRR